MKFNTDSVGKRNALADRILRMDSEISRKAHQVAQESSVRVIAQLKTDISTLTAKRNELVRKLAALMK